jgi:hypothetical protein
VSDFLAPSQILSSFADDFSVAASCPNIQVLEEALNADMVNIAARAARKKMSISSDKSKVTFFTPYTKEFNVKPQIYYQGSLIPVTNIIKILGLTLDTSHTGTPHDKIQTNRASGWVPILKAVMGPDWGFRKKTV